jgi:hypothetical protein
MLNKNEGKKEKIFLITIISMLIISGSSGIIV